MAAHPDVLYALSILRGDGRIGESAPSIGERVGEDAIVSRKLFASQGTFTASSRSGEPAAPAG